MLPVADLHAHRDRHRPTATVPMDSARPAILRPFDRREALTLREAADRAGRSPDTVRRWCEEHGLGRKVAGAWMVSRVALAMFLDDDPPALRAYLAGERAGPLIEPYLLREGLAEAVEA